MIQVRIPKKYNMEIFYNNDYKNFQKSKDGKYYFRNYEEASEDIVSAIKSKYKNAIFSLFISEKGGLEEVKEDSYVRIVCDAEGGKVLPLFKIKKEFRANLDHAFFKGYDLCTVEVFYEKKSCMYRIKHFTIDKYTGEYFEETLYESKVKNRISMPRKLKRFDDALDAACEKIKDSQCTRVYYSLQQ